MRGRRAPRIGVIAAVAPLVMLIGLRSAWALYSCRLDGQGRAACCCAPPPGQAHARAQRTAPDPTLAPGCCQVDLHLADQAPPVQTAARADLHAPPAAVAIALDVVAPPPAPVPARADRAQARPPPLATFLDKQSILR
jgi:hypothetical protein